MHNEVVWAFETADLFTGRHGSPWGARRYVIVEALPDGGWDWAAWVYGVRDACLYGQSDTPGRAMAAAELAVAELAG